MRKAAVLVLAAPMLLIGAAYPLTATNEAAIEAGEPGAAPAVAITYPPCRPGPGDDRCIQLYERGVRASYARWLRRHGRAPSAPAAAMGGPEEAPAPHASRHSEAGHRCIEGEEAETRGM